MEATSKSSKLQGKDLMNIGIYSAIYCVIVTGVAMLGYIPIKESKNDNPYCYSQSGVHRSIERKNNTIG